MGAIGRDRAFALLDRTAGLQIPSDLAGISLATYTPHSSGNIQAAIGAACTQIKQAINRAGPKLTNKVSIFQPVDSPTLFRLGTQLISEAKYRVALVARTPILITGPRPYGEKVQYPWEIEQFGCLFSLVEGARLGNGPEFRCVGSLTGLREELSQSPACLRQSVISNLSSVHRSPVDSLPLVSLRWLDDRHPMTYLVADDKFLLWLKDGDDKFCLQLADLRIANALWKLTSTNSKELSIDGISTLLGLEPNG